MAEYFPEQTTFYFDYPDNWTVIMERVGNDGESVILQNENGVKVCYDALPYIVYKYMYDFGSQYTSANGEQILSQDIIREKISGLSKLRIQVIWMH